jgi:PPIC-type PPIASE domain
VISNVPSFPYPHPMDPLKKTVIRLLVYGLVLGWIAGDLFLWHGILHRKIKRANPNSPEAIERAKAQGVVARVFNHVITRDQLERAVAERLWREGQTDAQPSKENMRMLRYAALDDLIDHELLRVKAKAHAVDLKVDPAALEARYKRFVSRFPSEQDMLAAAHSQGIGGKQQLRERIAAWMQQEAYVELKIAPLCQVTDDEVRAWWDVNKAQFQTPERARVRHIFLPTLDRDAAEVKKHMEVALSALTAGSKTFEELAQSLSEDSTSKDKGGDLGWMTRDRIPADFAAAVFDREASQPALIQTRIGWHIIEITGRQPASTRSFEQAAPEARAALESARRDKAVREYHIALRQFEAHKIHVFHDMLDW